MIELMIVVAIIAILAAIAIPQYEVYVARSQVTAGLADITPGRTAYELLIDSGVQTNGTYTDVNNLNLQPTTPRCLISSSPLTNGQGSITCTLINSSTLITNGTSTITWQRSASGSWQCIAANLPSAALPPDCTE